MKSHKSAELLQTVIVTRSFKFMVVLFCIQAPTRSLHISEWHIPPHTPLVGMERESSSVSFINLYHPLSLHPHQDNSSHQLSSQSTNHEPDSDAISDILCQLRIKNDLTKHNLVCHCNYSTMFQDDCLGVGSACVISKPIQIQYLHIIWNTEEV